MMNFSVDELKFTREHKFKIDRKVVLFNEIQKN